VSDNTEPVPMQSAPAKAAGKPGYTVPIRPDSIATTPITVASATASLYDLRTSGFGRDAPPAARRSRSAPTASSRTTSVADTIAVTAPTDWPA